MCNLLTQTLYDLTCHLPAQCCVLGITLSPMYLNTGPWKQCSLTQIWDGIDKQVNRIFVHVRSLAQYLTEVNYQPRHCRDQVIKPVNAQQASGDERS